MKPAERLDTAQGSDETGTDFLARLRQTARYCKFVTVNTSADPETELIRPQFLAGLEEYKNQLCRPTRSQRKLTVEELLQTLRNRSEPIKFASGPDSTTSSKIVAFSSETDSAQDLQNELDVVRSLAPKGLNAQPSTKSATQAKRKGTLRRFVATLSEVAWRKEGRKNVNHASDMTD